MTRSTARRRFAATALIALSCWASSMTVSPRDAHAQSPAVVAEALFNEGRALYEKGRFQEACEKFARSEALDPGTGTLFNLAECYERSHRLASAWGAYREAYSLAVTRKNSRAAALAEEAAARLAPRLAHLTIKVRPPALDVPNLTITRNKEPVERPAFDTPIPVDAGTQTIVTSALHYKSHTDQINISDGTSSMIVIPALEPEPEQSQSKPPIPNPPEKPTSGGSTQETVGLGLGIGGAAILVTGLVLGGVAIAKWGSVTDECPNGFCPNQSTLNRRRSDEESARTFATVSTIATSVGLVALGAGLIMWFTVPDSRARQTRSALSSGFRF